MKRAFICVCIILSALLFESSAYTDEDTLVLRFAHGGTADHPYQIGAVRFAEIVQRESNGDIKIEIYPDGELGSEGEAGEGVRLGIIDIAVISAGGMMSHWVPEVQVFDMPYLFRSREHAYKVLDGEVGEYFNKKMEERGFRNLDYWEIGVRHMTNIRREVKYPADIEGMKIRVMAANVYRAMMRELNAIPIPIPFTKVYSAFQGRIIDGQENPVTTIRAMRFYEVQKYLSLTAHTYSSAVVIMNSRKYDALSRRHKQILGNAAMLTGAYQRNYVRTKESEDIEYLKKQGMVVTMPDRASFAKRTANVAHAMSDEISEAMIQKIKSVK